MATLLLLTGSCATSVADFTGPPDETYEAGQVAEGEELYLRGCSACHGRDGGGGVGPNLRQVWERLTPEEHVLVIENGRATMPAFGTSLSDEEIRAIVAFERTGWTNPPKNGDQ